jgi:hypothetical protein
MIYISLIVFLINIGLVFNKNNTSPNLNIMGAVFSMIAFFVYLDKLLT